MRTFAPICLVIVLLAVACGEDAVVEQPEGEDVPLREDASPAPPNDPISEDVGRLLEYEVDQDPAPATTDSKAPSKPATPEPSQPNDSTSPETRRGNGPPEQTESALAAGYDLATVDGKGLPAVTDTRPSCQIEIVSGHLAIDRSSRFELKTVTRERCNGRITAEDSWDAMGTVQRNGSALRFEGSSGDAFGEAQGRLDAGAITITSVSTEGGVEQVNWKFVKD